MSYKTFGIILSLLLLTGIADLTIAANVTGATAGNRQPAQPAAAEVQTITAEELKARVAKNERVTIIDVRSTSNYVESGNKIKGAIHVKLRRLRSRLFVAPLKDVPRDREIVTYCACPADEASIEAAQVLLDAGFKHVRVLKGGWQVWLKANGPVEARPKG